MTNLKKSLKPHIKRAIRQAKLSNNEFDKFKFGKLYYKSILHLDQILSDILK